MTTCHTLWFTKTVYFKILKVNLKFFNIYSSNNINFKYNYRFLRVGGAYGSR